MELDGLTSTGVPPPAANFTFDLWPNQCVPGPGTYVTQFWRN